MVDLRDQVLEAAAAELDLRVQDVPDHVDIEMARIADMVSDDGDDLLGLLREAEEELTQQVPALLLRANIRRELVGLLSFVEANPNTVDIDAWHCLPAKLLLTAEDFLPEVSDRAYTRVMDVLGCEAGKFIELEELPSGIPEPVSAWSRARAVERDAELEAELQADPSELAWSADELDGATDPPRDRGLSAEDRAAAEAHLVSRARQESLTTDIKDTLLFGVVGGFLVGMLVVYLLILPLAYGILDVHWVGDLRDVLIAWAVGGVGMLMWKSRRIEHRKAEAANHYASLTDAQLADTYCRSIHPLHGNDPELWNQLARHRR